MPFLNRSFPNFPSIDIPIINIFSHYKYLHRFRQNHPSSSIVLGNFQVLNFTKRNMKYFQALQYIFLEICKLWEIFEFEINATQREPSPRQTMGLNNRGSWAEGIAFATVRSFLVSSVRWIIAFVNRNEREVVADSLIRNEERRYNRTVVVGNLQLRLLVPDMIFYLAIGDKGTGNIVRSFTLE